MTFSSRRTAALVFLSYAAAFALAAGLAFAFGSDPFVTSAWLGTQGLVAVVLSVGFGLIVGAVTLAVTPPLVRRAAWARALHADLRPVVRGASDTTLFAMAIASGCAEEILFRGVLTPAIGVILSSLAFGVLHQVRGSARWGWMAWATLMGLVLALVFRATGSLAGPIVAHVYVNAQNLRFLRDHDLAPSPMKRLGGLLRRA